MRAGLAIGGGAVSFSKWTTFRARRETILRFCARNTAEFSRCARVSRPRTYFDRRSPNRKIHGEAQRRETCGQYFGGVKRPAPNMQSVMMLARRGPLAARLVSPLAPRPAPLYNTDVTHAF
jgi:hypothetical protein